MNKRVLVVGLAASAFGVLAGPALAQTVEQETPIGTVTVTNNGTGGSVVADGYDSNPAAGAGYVAASGDVTDPQSGSLCADDNGAPGASSSPTCLEDNTP